MCIYEYYVCMCVFLYICIRIGEGSKALEMILSRGSEEEGEDHQQQQQQPEQQQQEGAPPPTGCVAVLCGWGPPLVFVLSLLPPPSSRLSSSFYSLSQVLGHRRWQQGHVAQDPRHLLAMLPTGHVAMLPRTSGHVAQDIFWSCCRGHLAMLPRTYSGHVAEDTRPCCPGPQTYSGHVAMLPRCNGRVTMLPGHVAMLPRRQTCGGHYYVTRRRPAP